MIPLEVYRLLVRMARTAGLAIPTQATPIDDSAWVQFFTRLKGHVS